MYRTALASLILTLCLQQVRTSEGFVAGTLVQTPSGPRCIESIRPGDLVIGYDVDRQCTAIDTVIANRRYASNNLVAFRCAGNLIVCGSRQRFYGGRGGDVRWLSADAMGARDEHLAMQDALEAPTALYALSTQHYHNFFAGSERPILAHNVVLELGVLWGASVIVDITIPALTAAAVWLGLKLFGKDKPPITIKTPNENDWHHYLKKPGHNFNGKDPKRIWELVQRMLLAAIAQGELQEDAKFALQELTEYGILEVVGKVVDGTAKIGTMYIKESSA